MEHFSKEQYIQEMQYNFPYHYLGLYSEVYRELIHRHYLSILKTNVSLLKPFTGQRLLDVGCGDGRFCYELRRENVEIYGIDYSNRAIAFAKAFNPSGQFLVGNVTELNYDNFFDIIALIEVLEHIPLDEINICIASLKKQLKPGGRLLLSVPSVNLPLQKKHYQHFTPEMLLRHFKDGFNLIIKKGHTKSGKAWKHYVALRKRGQVLWPLRGKIPFIKKYTDNIIRYYESIKMCEIEQAISLIFMFEKMS